MPFDGKVEGEGESKLIRKERVRARCEICGDAATKRIGFAMPNARRNPASTSYGKDDCSWCSDHDAFTCDACPKNNLSVPEGYSWANSFSIERFPHLFLEWVEREVPASQVILLTPPEIQSKHDRVRWAEGLIRQLPEHHDGRNSWLLNYAAAEASA